MATPERFDADVVVIGSGAAGLMAALAASAASDVLLVTDGPLGRSNTMMAQGGLQLPRPDEAARERFEADVIASARVPINRARLARFAREIAPTIDELAARGLAFDRDAGGAGDYVRRAVAGTSEPRLVSVADQIGPAVMKVLIAAVRRAPIEVREHVQIVDLRLLPGAGGVAGGGFALAARAPGGALELRARAVIAATGGTSHAEAHRRGVRTTNPANTNHVLFDRLRALGLSTVPGDHFQFQPYGLVERAAGLDKCVPESIVTLPVVLRDGRGRTFAPGAFDRLALTERMFAAARDGEAALGAAGEVGLWLTLGDVAPDVLAARFPRLHHLLAREGWLGTDVLVFPFLHYQLGGFAVDGDGATALPGLWLAGEMVGGLHGKNRLMGNGLTDSLVFGRLAGRAAALAVAARAGRSVTGGPAHS